MVGAWRAAAIVTLFGLGACGDDVARGEPYQPSGETSAGSAGTGDGECMPGVVSQCACPGGELGWKQCLDDGSFADCECDDSTTSTDTGTSDETSTTAGETDGGFVPGQVCYPGEDDSWTTCFDVYALDPVPAGYEYPPAYQDNPNYRPPIVFLDLEELDSEVYLAPNFRLGEVAQLWKGRWAVVQPHAIVEIQKLRDQVGAIVVNSGYRSPAYNTQVDGATHSRHMYGDAFDMDPVDVGLATLESACEAAGGMLVEYTTHVHCDWRFDPVDEIFFGAEEDWMPVVVAEPFAAELVQHAGIWQAPASGFDEGEPTRRWVAWDGDGDELAREIGAAFVAPPGTAVVEVSVGARVRLSAPVLAR